MHGLELINSGMNDFQKYGSAIKFMSTDPHHNGIPQVFSRYNSKAEEYYTSDNDGGMAIDFATTPSNRGK